MSSGRWYSTCHRTGGQPHKAYGYQDYAGSLSERFDNLPSLDPGIIDRHKTIQAAIDWSYNLLSEDEKALFRRLSVFSGGFDLIAAEEVCANESLPKERILDLLSQLVDRSMIQTLYQPKAK